MKTLTLHLIKWTKVKNVWMNVCNFLPKILLWKILNKPTGIIDCCRTYEIRGNGNHPFAYDINKLYGVYTRMPKLYHGQSPIWNLEGTNTYLYKKNNKGASKDDHVPNLGRGYWSIGEIIDGSQKTAFAY